MLSVSSRVLTQVRTLAENISPDDRLAAHMMKSFRHAYIKVHSLGPDTLAHTTSGHAVDWKLEEDGLASPSQSRRGVRLIWSMSRRGENAS